MTLLDGEADSLGFPTLDSTKLWSFSVHKLRLSKWRLYYEAFPTGYAASLHATCFEAACT